MYGGFGCSGSMCPILFPKISLLEMQSTSGPLIWIPVIGGRGAVFLPICERVGIGLAGTTPVGPKNCRRLRALGGGFGGTDCHLFSSWILGVICL